MKIRHFDKSDRGSLALEYILISAFTAMVALAAMAYVSRIIKDKLAKIEAQIGVDFEGEFDGLGP